MIKRYYLIAKKYFSLGANNKKLLAHLFISATLKSITLLLIPFMASLIIKYVTILDLKMTLVSAFLFLSASSLYVLVHHYNYNAYSNNAAYVHNKLQELIMDKVTSYDENFTKNISTSYIINTAFNDVGKVQCVADLAFDVVTAFIAMVVVIVIMLSVNLFIGIITSVLVLLTIYVVGRNMKRRDYYLVNQRREQDNVSSLMGQVLDGNKEIKSFNMEAELESYLNKYKKNRARNYFKKRIYDNNISVIVPAILGIGKVFVYGILIYLILAGSREISVLVLVIGYYQNIQDNYEKFYGCLNDLSSNSIRIDRVYNILNYKNKNMLEFGEIDNDFISGKVEFKHVSFTYEDVEVMKDVSFKIRPNSFTAIVGKSGSGKSTIFRLLLRLYKAETGVINLDDISIYDYTKEVYSSNVSIVTQKPFIFDMSIRENLNLVDSNHEHQIEACKRAGIHDYIMSLKDGYNTKLVRDAENISMGQKQLIALARTLLSKAEVLLFDEVTSSLDVETSKKVMRILKDLKKDHTILMITHKPTLMAVADEVIVIDHGKVVGKGTHASLLKDNEYYQVLQK